MKFLILAAMIAAPRLCAAADWTDLAGLGAAGVAGAAQAFQPPVPQVRTVQVILNTQTGHTHNVIQTGGGFIDTATGQFYAATFNGSGYILPTGQYLPVVNGKRGDEAGAGRWAALVEKTLEFGLVKVPNGNVPAGRYFADISGAQSGPHKSDYFSIWGHTGEDGAFIPEYVTMVSENWAIGHDGNWHIDQWLHWVGLDGTPAKNEHTVLVEEAGGSIVSMHSDKPEVTAPAAQANREALIAKWALYKPAAK
jgi:hypothetical protein